MKQSREGDVETSALPLSPALSPSWRGVNKRDKSESECTT
jgi:hypothetical protein